jgi:flagellar protein FlaG
MDMAISNVNSVMPAVSPMPGAATGNSHPQAAQTFQEIRPISNEAANQLLQQIQSHVQSMNISLSFSTYGKKGEDISVVVTDRDTGKVIREIPPKEIQDLYTKIGELVGLILNHSA